MRLTTKGRLLLCLGQNNFISLRDALRTNMSDDEIKQLIIRAINFKPERHEFDSQIHNISGAIGG